MKKRLFWTTAALLTTALGTPLSTHAKPNEAANPSRVNTQATSPHVPPAQPLDVIKVGEYQSTAGTKANDTVIARIQPHELASSRPAATLYVHNIPVLTFLGSSSVVNGGKKIGTSGDAATTGTPQTKIATIGNLPNLTMQASAGSDDNQATDPVWRATEVAAKLNQLSQTNMDANAITVTWQAGDKPENKKLGDRYLIKVNGEELVEIDSETRLPDTTNDPAKDALQATNRLRRLLGNAAPLREISGMPLPVPLPKLPNLPKLSNLPKLIHLPKLPQSISLGPIQVSLSGWASWYGPECQGSRSASGEIFNQYAFTAAHRSLPFGTQVRVTNTRTGRSVVVRINDRGPYIHGRIIDLSTAAARVLGLVESGVAPVRVDVLGNHKLSVK